MNYNNKQKKCRNTGRQTHTHFLANLIGAKRTFKTYGFDFILVVQQVAQVWQNSEHGACHTY
jgi:hypothetical protein